MNKKKKEFNRFTALLLITMFIFASIAARLTVLQVVKADEYKDKANTKAITEITEPAPRGEIFFKDGTKLATNVQSYNLIFTETEDSSLRFYDTMDAVFKVLDDNGETQKDNFELKLNPFRFEFKAQDEDTRRTLELRFKKDKGLNEKVIKSLGLDKKKELDDEDLEKINEELLKITPEETFNFLVEQYKVSPSGIFEKILSKYKTYPEDVLDILSHRYNVAITDEVKNTLIEYSKASKKEIKEPLFESLMKKFNVENTTLTKDEQLALERRYMLVKDAIKMQSFSGYKPITIASKIKKETAFIFSQRFNDLPGIDITMQPMREYPQGQLASAIVGYISKIGNNTDKYEERGYDPNTDYIGIQGIEAAFEDRLKGSKGGRIVKLNRYGRVIEELGRRDSYPGQNIQLTLDKNVQYAAETALDKVMLDLQKRGRVKDVNMSNATRGAAVVVDVKTGAILALASRPGFNPNDFADPRGLSTEAFKKYFNPDFVEYGKSRGLSDAMIEKLFPERGTQKKRSDPYDFVPKLLYNYASYSLVPPGSTFKPMTAIAGLESGAITEGFKVPDNGTFTGVDGKTYEFGFRYGNVTLTRALGVSSNPYFMTVGDKLLKLNKGYDILAQYAWKFGLGVNPETGAKATTGIETGDYFGNVSSLAWNHDKYAANYRLATMELLKSGKGHYRISKFTPIDIYDNAGDTFKLAQLKKEFKSKIYDIIYTGATDIGESRRDSYVIDIFTDYLTKIIDLDPQYKGKNISKNEISAIAYEMYKITIDDGYAQSILPFNMYQAAIGQGTSTFTPLQLANYVATIANGGTRYRLHVVDKITDADGKVIQEIKPEVMEETGVKPSTITAVKAGMAAVTGEDGTAREAFKNFPISTGGKTGSATYSEKQEELGRTSYGVYVGFAPFENPEIAVAVLIFDGGHGGYIAPVARAVYEAYFKEQLDAMGYVPQFDVVSKPIQ